MYGNVMYRTEDFSGLGERDPVDVLTYESYEMLNVDTIEYLSKTYLQGNEKLKFEGECCRDMVVRGLNGTKMKNDLMFRNFFSKALAEVQKATGRKISYVLWLADRIPVIEFYGELLDAFTIDAYDITDGIVLDDLGYDGKLYGFESEVFPVQTENYYKEEV